jgi:EmrB/QacA subfamily drug resistance transporter
MTHSADRATLAPTTGMHPPPLETTPAAQTAKNPWLALLALGLGFFMILLDTTIVNVAVPSISDVLHSSLEQILWVLNAYVLIYAVLLITGGRLGDLFGLRTLFVVGLAIFTLASAACGLAQDTSQLIAARVVQGIGGALLTPQTLAVLTTIFPPERRAAAFGMWGAIAGIAAVTGPTLGGFLVTSLNWRSIFFVNVPIGVAALVATFWLVPDLRPHRRQPLDVIGVILATLGLFGVVFGLIEGQRYEWGAIWGPLAIPHVILAGVLVLVVFGVWERTRAEPLLPVQMLRNRTYVVMNGVGAAITFAVLGMFLPLVIYLQSALGMTAWEAGLTIAPMPLTSMVTAPVAGRLADRFGAKYVLLAGLLLYSLGMGLVIWIASPSSAPATFIGPLVIAGLGNGSVYGPAAALAMRDVPRPLAGGASGLYNTTRQLGAVVGTAIVGAVLQNRLATLLYPQAVSASDQLSPPLRERFIDSFSSLARVGLEVGRAAQAGLVALPSGLSPEVATQVQTLAHSVFAQVFVDAMRPTLAVPIAVVVLAAVSCLAVRPGAPPAASMH